MGIFDANKIFTAETDTEKAAYCSNDTINSHLYTILFIYDVDRSPNERIAFLFQARHASLGDLTTGAATKVWVTAATPEGEGPPSPTLSATPSETGKSFVSFFIQHLFLVNHTTGSETGREVIQLFLKPLTKNHSETTSFETGKSKNPF